MLVKQVSNYFYGYSLYWRKMGVPENVLDPLVTIGSNLQPTILYTPQELDDMPQL